MANKSQRRINRFVRHFNKTLASDAVLGLNRYSVHQIVKNGYYPETRYLMKIVDNRTGQSQEFAVDNFDYKRELFWRANHFIVNIRRNEI